MVKEQFDVKMQVLFCDKHKKFFEEKVKLKSGKDDCIKPREFADLLKESETCTDCEWKTTFGRTKSFFG